MRWWVVKGVFVDLMGGWGRGGKDDEYGICR